jgi:hypothetical protein
MWNDEPIRGVREMRAETKDKGGSMRKEGMEG